jgi:hypothetical protein
VIRPCGFSIWRLPVPGALVGHNLIAWKCVRWQNLLLTMVLVVLLHACQWDVKRLIAAINAQCASAVKKLIRHPTPWPVNVTSTFHQV